jgi:acyl-CoA synthetase (AMP-forming)/AMP-acid ligase II
MVDLNSAAVPLVLFGSAAAGKPFVPISYRLSDDRLAAAVARTAPASVVVGPGVGSRLKPIEGITLVPREEVLATAARKAGPAADLWSGDPDDIAVLLFTSGTSGEPKAAVLRHRNVASYIVSTVEFMGAGDDECALVSVPAYHIAGISAVLSSAYAGRRVVYLEAFDAKAWVELARAEQVTHAMVVPTMLNRILDVIDDSQAGDGRSLPSLRNLAYGGGPMPLPVIERALHLLPHVGFVNSYGLTETSSTIAVLGPQEHREALAAAEGKVRARLHSAGRPLPSVEVSIRDRDGAPVPDGTEGEIWVRGEQVAGEYLSGGGRLRDGWFATRDGGYLDGDGYLFVKGRMDDVIVRGGENLSPGEIEQALVSHPAVLQAAVVGIPDVQWGEAVAAAVVLHPGAAVDPLDLQAHVRQRLRSTMTPAVIVIRDTLPYNETGKLLRRLVRDELLDSRDRT